MEKWQTSQAKIKSQTYPRQIAHIKGLSFVPFMVGMCCSCSHRFRMNCGVGFVFIGSYDKDRKIYILMITVNNLYPFFNTKVFTRNGKHVPCVVIQFLKYLWKFGNIRKSCGKPHPTTHVSTAFLIFPSFHSCFHTCNSIETCLFFLNYDIVWN